MPLSDCDSMCSMSLTVVVMPRSLLKTMRFGHLLRGEAGVLPDDGHHRNVDVRKDIRGHRFDAVDAKDQDQKREDDEGIRPPQRKPDNPHHRAGIRSSSKTAKSMDSLVLVSVEFRARAAPGADAESELPVTVAGRPPALNCDYSRGSVTTIRENTMVDDETPVVPVR